MKLPVLMGITFFGSLAACLYFTGPADQKSSTTNFVQTGPRNAEAVVAQMASFIRGSGFRATATASVFANSTTENLPQPQRLHIQFRPDPRLSIATDERPIAKIDDKNICISALDGKTWTKMPAEPYRGLPLQCFPANHEATMFVTVLLCQSCLQEFTNSSAPMTLSGAQSIGGHPCSIVQIESADGKTRTRIWIDASSTPFPRQIEIAHKGARQAAASTIEWEKAKRLNDSEFRFTPESGSRLVTLDQLKRRQTGK